MTICRLFVTTLSGMPDELQRSISGPKSDDTHIGIIRLKAIPEEYNRRLILSNFCDDFVSAPEPPELLGITFLKKIFEETNTMADPNADASPMKSAVDISNEQASMTPTVRGNNDM